MIIYRIRDWNEHFENFKSRERDHCSYVCLPNKQHGLGLSRILSLKDGAAVFGIWVLIVEACSRQKRPRDGWLTQDGYQAGTPWIPSDLALMWRRPEAEIQRALDVLSSPEIGWIEVSGEYPSDTRVVSAGSPLGILEGKGKEGKERKGSEAEAPAASPLPPEGFISFMAFYPSQVERSRAEKNWKALVKKKVVTEGELIEAAKNYAADVKAKNTDPQYIIKPANFLGRDERYKDFLTANYHPQQGKPEPVRDPAFEEARRKLREEVFRT